MSRVVLNFKVTIEYPDAPDIFQKWSYANKFPPSLQITELDVLSILRMSRNRNQRLHKKFLEWYGRIDQKFRMI